MSELELMAREIIRRAEWLVRNNSTPFYGPAGVYDFSYSLGCYDLHLSEVEGRPTDVWVEDEAVVLVELEDGDLKVYCSPRILKTIDQMLRRHMVLDDIAGV